MRPIATVIVLLWIIAVVYCQVQPQLVEPQIIQPQPPHQQENIQTNTQQSQQAEPTARQQHHPSSTEGFDWENLTDEQKQQLLAEQAKLTKIHKNPQVDITVAANLTIDEKTQFQRKMQQRAKVAYEQAMRDMQERERKHVEEYNRMMQDQKLTMTQQINHKEQVEFRERQNQFNPRQYENKVGSFYRHQFNQYMFELDRGQISDFVLTLPVAQNVAFFLYSYSNKNGVYSMTRQISQTSPPDVTVTENNYNIIKNQSFYFRKYIIFQGKDHYTYTIKVNNPGQPRLFALSVVHLLEHSHISSALDSDSIENHGPRAKALYQQLQQQITHSQSRRMMEVSNQHKLTGGIQIYYSYLIVQILVVMGGCWLQLKMIEKLLKDSSIV